jgi:DNA-binding response OmpR family regulator
MKTKILIVEDDPHILLGLEEVLKSEGYETASCNRGDEAVAAVAKFQPSLIVLDVMLPGASGYDICKQLRAKKISAPILMLTAKGQEIDKVVGLDLGADDYVTKPFGVRELLARIHALLRRGGSSTSNQVADENPFKIGVATIDPKTFQVKRGRAMEELTAKELKLL